MEAFFYHISYPDNILKQDYQIRLPRLNLRPRLTTRRNLPVHPPEDPEKSLIPKREPQHRRLHPCRH